MINTKSWLLEKYRVSPNAQLHGLCYCRGAIAFALAIRKATEGTPQVQIFLTTTIILVMLTVIGCGALTLSMLRWLKIRYSD